MIFPQFHCSLNTTITVGYKSICGIQLFLRRQVVGQCLKKNLLFFFDYVSVDLTVNDFQVMPFLSGKMDSISYIKQGWPGSIQIWHLLWQQTPITIAWQNSMMLLWITALYLHIWVHFLCKQRMLFELWWSEPWHLVERPTDITSEKVYYPLSHFEWLPLATNTWRSTLLFFQAV